MSQRFILIGPPACGKGTQGRRLAMALGLDYLSTGAMLREHMAQGTGIGRLAKPILDRGAYLPDDLMCEIIRVWLANAGEGWVLDGFPRSVPQAEFLQEELASLGRPLTAAIALQAPLALLKTRIGHRVECPACRWSGGLRELVDRACPECGSEVAARDDDDPENFISRHQAYLASALPLVEHYRQQGLLCSCDATRSRDEVTAELLGRLACPTGDSPAVPDPFLTDTSP